MKLSEAIREGAKIRPQTKQSYFTIMDNLDSETEDTTVCSCAIGAAYEAITGSTLPNEPDHSLDKDAIANTVAKHTGANFEKQVFPPHLGYGVSLFSSICYLNDQRDWTREQIADWLESINL